MALRRPPTTFSDQITATDIGSGAVDTDELAADAVTSSKIATGAVIADGIGAGAVVAAGLGTDAVIAVKIQADAVTSAKIATGAVIADGIGAGAVVAAGLGTGAVTAAKLGDVIGVKPHIIPDVLHPAIAGKGIDGTTTITSFGTDVAISGYPTLQYYYTDIKGSKPIKDPRIGAHFGSQRYKFKSAQKLDEHHDGAAGAGLDVFSLDGREWARAVGPFGMENDTEGQRVLYFGDSDCFLEVVGYWNDANLLANLTINYDNWTVQVNGGTAQATDLLGDQTNIQNSRYYDAFSSVKLVFHASSNTPGATPAIRTLRINKGPTHAVDVFGIELIAQDTGNRNNIQISSQNVVSYGKKFTVSGTPHHNPFAQSQTGVAVTINSSTTNTAKLAGGWSGTGATYYSSELDSGTSLGLASWVSGGEYFRPVNGGRVVWWVSSTGTLKCSVNMMPPAGTSAGGATGGHNVPTGVHNWATKYQPALYSTTMDNSQAEVAKTYHWREFGNGSANQGKEGDKADPSMVDGSDDATWIMDDGLTSLTLQGCTWYQSTGTNLGMGVSGGGNHWYMNFIGTGLSIKTPGGYQHNLVQNLPYGTHTLKVNYTTPGVWTVDGIQIISSSANNNFWTQEWVTFHQPKMPPIPENACIIADYMLMADHVAASGSVDTLLHISKGVRRVSPARDFYMNAESWPSNPYLTIAADYPSGLLQTHAGSLDGCVFSLPTFSTSYNPISITGKYTAVDRGGATGVSVSEIGSSTTKLLKSAPYTLGTYNGQTTKTSTGDFFNLGAEVATPTHTSSHYQNIENQFTNEIGGGDRNMEQTNLVVTPDGKTWDEVTRDTSYIGNVRVMTHTDTVTNWSAYAIFDEWRGDSTGLSSAGAWNRCNKDFAIAYDRFICLVDGQYSLTSKTRTSSTSQQGAWHLNEEMLFQGGEGSASVLSENFEVTMKRGDYLRYRGQFGYDTLMHNYVCVRRI